MSNRLPDFVCIGAMRCGTTTLWDLLKRHSNVFLPEKKEIHFFDGFSDTWRRGETGYREYFSDCPDDSVCGEITPSYLYIEEACDRMACLIPAAQLVVVLRDPVDRAWSHYWFEVCAGREVLPFRKAVESEEKRLRRGGLQDRIHRSYFSRGLYAPQLARFSENFGKEKICVLSMSDLVNDSVATASKVLRHIGAVFSPVEGDNSAGHRNQGWHPRSRYVCQTERWWSCQMAGKHTISGRIGRRLGRSVHRFNRLEGVPRMMDRDRQWLATRYEESDAALRSWFGGRLPWREESV